MNFGVLLGIAVICSAISVCVGVVIGKRLQSKRPVPAQAPLADQVESLFGLLLRTYGLYLLIRPMLVNSELIARHGEPEKRAAFEELRNVLYWTFILELIKLCKDGDPRSPCIAKIIRMIKVPAVREQLERESSRTSLPKLSGEPPDTYEALAAAESAALRERFRRAYAKTLDAADRLAKMPALNGYRQIRNKRIAHNELVLSANGTYDFLEIAGLNLKYGDERAVLEQVREVMDGLSSVVRGTSFDWSSFLDPATREAKAFWGIADIG